MDNIRITRGMKKFERRSKILKGQTNSTLVPLRSYKKWKMIKSSTLNNCRIASIKGIRARTEGLEILINWADQSTSSWENARFVPLHLWKGLIPDTSSKAPSSKVESRESRQLYVDAILSSKMEYGQKFFQVKWEGYKNPTWEPESNIPSTLIHDFFSKLASSKLASSKLASSKLASSKVESSKVESRGSRQFYVDAILSSKMEYGQKFFQLKWEGYKKPTWEPESNIPSTLIHDFFSRTNRMINSTTGKMTYIKNLLKYKWEGSTRIFKVQWEGSSKLTWENVSSIPAKLVTDFDSVHIYAGTDSIPVNCLIGHRKIKGVDHYKVDWLGEDESATWEPYYNITSDLIKQWNDPSFKTGDLQVTEKDFDKRYNDSTISLKKTKIKFNNVWCRTIKSTSASDGRIMFLDGETGNSTRFLIEHGIPNTRQPVNFDIGPHRSILSKNLPNTVPFYGTLYESIKKCSHPIKALWFDYMSTFDGGKSSCYPKVDIKLLFESKKLMDNSVVAFTFSNRIRIRTWIQGVAKNLSVTQKITRIRTWIQGVAKNNGYVLTLVHKERYHPAEMFLCYTAKKL